MPGWDLLHPLVECPPHQCDPSDKLCAMDWPHSVQRTGHMSNREYIIQLSLAEVALNELSWALHTSYLFGIVNAHPNALILKILAFNR